MIRRWSEAVHARLAKVEGLVYVLMKPRNGQRWTREDRAFLRGEFQRLEWSPSLFLFHAPGMAPLLAWLFDRRRRPTNPRPGGHRKGDYVGGAIG